MKCRILIDNCDYSSWKFHDFDSNVEIDNEQLTNIDPVKLRLFTNDIIDHDGNIICSNVRSCPLLAGTLILNKNRTYGKTHNGKKFYYKCVPDDYRLPSFILPYDMKMGFSKKFKNKYVIFKFNEWKGKHPIGTMLNVLGDVDDLIVFYEYQLYRRNLNDSNTSFSTHVHKLFKNDNYKECIETILNNQNYNIQDRTHTNVFSIDPKGSKDLDDAFSIIPLGGGLFKMSIYIANVYFWMEEFGLWESFHNRVSTIYFPDKRRPMLPNILSDNLCSLLEKHSRFAFCMDIVIDENGVVQKKDNGEEHITMINAMVRVRNNYAYEDYKMKKDVDYMNLLRITKNLNYDICDSHDVVAHWMVFMNTKCGELMAKNKFGIYRSALHKASPIVIDNPNIKGDMRRMIENWGNIAVGYTLYDDNSLSMRHDVLNTNNYVHITSPIRRLVDLLNQFMFMQKLNMINNVSECATTFLNKWLNKIDYINDSTRSIRKVQSDCELMTMCVKKPELLDEIYDGIILDSMVRNNGIVTYVVYLEKLKMLQKVTTTEILELHSHNKFKLHYFGDEYNAQRKVRVVKYHQCQS
jgi:exoribonuclease R